MNTTTRIDLMRENDARLRRGQWNRRTPLLAVLAADGEGPLVLRRQSRNTKLERVLRSHNLRITRWRRNHLFDGSHADTDVAR